MYTLSWANSVRCLATLILCGMLSACPLTPAPPTSCQACRDDCIKNNIPPSQCNCQGCTGQ
jgi:hypothetical protein